MTSDEYIKTHWDKNSIWKNNRHMHHLGRLTTIASLVRGTDVIDVGCCLGHSTDSLKCLHPGNWSGLDFSQFGVDKAKKTFPELTFYFAKDFNLLPVCGKYDTVVCSEVLEHVADEAGLVKGLLEITKDILIMTTPNRRVGDPGHVRVCTVQSLEKLLEGTKHTIKSVGMFFYITVEV